MNKKADPVSIKTDNNPVISQELNNPDFFTGLGNTLRSVEEWKMIEYHKIRKIENSKLTSEAITHYLNTEFHNLYMYQHNVKGPSIINMLANIIPYIQENYKTKIDEVISHLDKFVHESRAYLTHGRSIYDDMRFGFSFDDTISIPGRGITEIPCRGITFLEDDDGFRLVVELRTSENYGGVKECQINIISSDLDPRCRIKTREFYKGLADFSREHTIFTAGAYNMKGERIETGNTSWHDFKISKDIKKQIDFHILKFLDLGESLRVSGFRSTRGIILCGKPGNGKTMFGKVLANCLNVPLIWVTAREMDALSSNNNFIQLTYQFANKISPAIVFIEDADIFLNGRFNNYSGHALSEFLNQIDGISQNNSVITIITANHPELLDEAIKNRPKRFDVIIEFTNPGPEQRREILYHRLKDRLDSDGLSCIDELSENLDDFSCAHITELADRLILSCLYNDIETISREMINSELVNFDFKPMISSKAGFIHNKN